MNSDDLIEIMTGIKPKEELYPVWDYIENVWYCQCGEGINQNQKICITCYHKINWRFD